jgi:hypothetical protein
MRGPLCYFSAVVEKLDREINAALADPKMKARLTDLGGAALPGSPADFGKLVADETEVGQGDEVRGHQAGVIHAIWARLFRNARFHRPIREPNALPTPPAGRYHYRRLGCADRRADVAAVSKKEPRREAVLRVTRFGSLRFTKPRIDGSADASDSRRRRTASGNSRAIRARCCASLECPSTVSCKTRASSAQMLACSRVLRRYSSSFDMALP